MVHIPIQIWAKSDDEKLEILIDEAVRSVQKTMQWNRPENVAMIYRDGIRSTDNDSDDDDEKWDELDGDNKIYFDFVEDIYDEIGAHKWFDKFVEKHYCREISIWRHRIETQKYLSSKQDIINLLLEPKIRQDLFTALDLNDNGKVEIHELRVWIQNQGYRSP